MKIFTSKKSNKVAKSVGILGIIGLSVLLVGCGKSGAKEDDTEFSIDSELVKEAELAVYVPQGKNKDFLEKATDLYNENNDTNISLKITDVTPGAATTQIVSPKLVANEKMPEIIFIQDTNAAGLLQEFPDSFKSASKFGFYDKYGKDYFPQKVDVLKGLSDGDAVGFGQDWGTVVAYYQPELFEKAGIKYDEIKSWDQMIEVGKKIKEKTETNLIALNETGDVDLILAIMDQQGVPLIDESGNVNLATEAAKNAAEIVQKLVEEDLVTWYSADDQEKAYQNSAMIITGGWYATNMEMNFPSAKDKWLIGTVVPYSEKNPGFSPVSGGSSWYIPEKSDNPLAAAQLLSFILTDKDAQSLALETGIMSANQVAFDTDAAKKPFEFYQNQEVLHVIYESSKNSSNVNIFPYNVDARAFVGAASYSYWKTKDFSKSYESEAKNLAAKYDISVNK